MDQQVLTGNSQQVTGNRQPLLVRFFAHFFSYVFHPLFIPVYITYFLAYLQPVYFAGFGDWRKLSLLLSVAINTMAFPLITVLLLKGVGFIDSVFLRTQKDRIIPYIASMTFFFWAAYALWNQQDTPRVLVAFLIGVFIASAAALIANIYSKISMHGIGVGGMLGFFIILIRQNDIQMTIPLCIALLISGIVCTSRLIVSDHSQKEVYTGFLLGAGTQFLSALIFL